MAAMLALNLFVLMFAVDVMAVNDCCVADQWSAGFDATLVYINKFAGRADVERLNGDVNMDYTGHRFAVNVTFQTYGSTWTYNERYIYLYKKGTMYQIMDDDYCFEESLEGPEPRQCLPDDAELEDTISVGENSLLLNSWKMRVLYQGMYGNLRFATTQENCVPVVSNFFGGGDYDGGYIVDAASLNYTSGYQPSAFTIPNFCYNASRKLKGKQVGRFDKWNLVRKGMIFF